MRQYRNPASQWELAVLDENNQAIGFTDSVDDAVDEAEAYAGNGNILTDHDGPGMPGGLTGNPYHDLRRQLHDEMELINVGEIAQGGARAAFELCGIEQVSGDEIMALTNGLTEADEIYKLLSPYFAPMRSMAAANKGERGEIAAYQTPDGLVKAILGGNEKVNKPRKGLSGTIKGLTLVPFWRNLQDEQVKRLPQNKDILKRVEDENIDTFKNGELIGRNSVDGTWCFGSSPACRRACLIGTGNNYQPYSFKVKFARAMALKRQPAAFLAAIALSSHRFNENQKRVGKQAFIRLNMLSDLPWEIICPDLFELVPDAQFYDYTKLTVHNRRIPRNYDLTFSFSGNNDANCGRALQAKHRVAMVFVSGDPGRSPFKKAARVDYKEIAKHTTKAVNYTWGGPNGTDNVVENLEVVDGDDSDFRAADPAPSIVALSYKGPKGIPKDIERHIRHKSRFAMIIPVRKMGDARITAHTPMQSPLTPSDID